MASKRTHLRRDPNSLVASAAVMTGKAKSAAPIGTSDWQTRAWTYYDSIGELRFAADWLSNALSRVNLVAAIPPVNQGDEPTPIDVNDPKTTPLQRRVAGLVAEIAGGPAGQGQMLGACARQLSVPGVGYIFANGDALTDTFETWRVLSNDEIRKGNGGIIEIADPETGVFRAVNADRDLIIKVWHAHARRAWEPDSSVHAVIPSLSEIDLLTKRIAADTRSRLQGNGLLLMPTEAEFAPGQPGVAAPSETADVFIQSFMQVGSVAIADPESPAATLPLVVRMPGEVIQHVAHLKFYSDYSAQLDTLRQAAVKRLALGLNMPPEVLLGMADSNHWTAWQVAEEAITLHIEPLAETICYALTKGFIINALMGDSETPSMTRQEAEASAMVWYDTTDLTSRPDLTAAATEAHHRIVISDAKYLEYIGLDAGDLLPITDPEFKRRMLVEVARGAPTLAPAMLAEAGIIDAAPAAAVEGAPGTPGAAPAADSPPPEPATGPPDTKDDQPDAQAASAALLAAADGLVVRAMERAGARLRSAAGKRVPGGAAAIACDDPLTMHLAYSATNFASLDHLLADAWGRVDEIAVRHHVGPESLTACLDGYCRGLLASGMQHTYERLAAVLGFAEGRTDDDRQLITAT